MSEQDLIDAILRHALELQRVAEYEQSKAEVILRELEQDLRIILARGDLTHIAQREVNAIIKEAQTAIAEKYINLAGVVDVDAVIEHVADRTVNLISEQYGYKMQSPLVDVARARFDVFIIDKNRTMAQLWEYVPRTAQNAVKSLIDYGLKNGRTNEQIIRSIMGDYSRARREYVGGVLPWGRDWTRKLVHSSVMTAANAARLETYRKNTKAAKGVQWMATLDSHTCRTCGALDGSEWDFDGKPLNGTKMLFQAPPAHINCRCVMTPVLKPVLDDIFGIKGLDEKLKPTVRASSQGPVKMQSFGQFLKRQSPEFIEDVLGAKRAELYKQGKITLTDLVTRAGRPKTLAEISR